MADAPNDTGTPAAQPGPDATGGAGTPAPKADNRNIEAELAAQFGTRGAPVLEEAGPMGGDLLSEVDPDLLNFFGVEGKGKKDEKAAGAPEVKDGAPKDGQGGAPAPAGAAGKEGEGATPPGNLPPQSGGQPPVQQPPVQQQPAAQPDPRDQQIQFLTQQNAQIMAMLEQFRNAPPAKGGAAPEATEEEVKPPKFEYNPAQLAPYLEAIQGEDPNRAAQAMSALMSAVAQQAAEAAIGYVEKGVLPKQFSTFEQDFAAKQEQSSIQKDYYGKHTNHNTPVIRDWVEQESVALWQQTKAPWSDQFRDAVAARVNARIAAAKAAGYDPTVTPGFGGFGAPNVIPFGAPAPSGDQQKGAPAGQPAPQGHAPMLDGSNRGGGTDNTGADFIRSTMLG